MRTQDVDWDEIVRLYARLLTLVMDDRSEDERKAYANTLNVIDKGYKCHYADGEFLVTPKQRPLFGSF